MQYYIILWVKCKTLDLVQIQDDADAYTILAWNYPLHNHNSNYFKIYLVSGELFLSQPNSNRKQN